MSAVRRRRFQIYTLLCLEVNSKGSALPTRRHPQPGSPLELLDGSSLNIPTRCLGILGVVGPTNLKEAKLRKASLEMTISPKTLQKNVL